MALPPLTTRELSQVIKFIQERTDEYEQESRTAAEWKDFYISVFEEAKRQYPGIT